MILTQQQKKRLYENNMTKTFLIYNNKGGVGKTTLTFTLASEFAYNHPDYDVLLVDLDPQCDLSQMVLGGNGRGWNNLEKIRKNDILDRNTICGYFETRTGSMYNKTNKESDYVIHCETYNSNMPNNVYLLCGDEDLSTSMEQIDNFAQASEKTGRNSWSSVHKWLHDLIYGVCEKKLRKDVAVFIDAEPAFSMYTKMGIFAANHIIVPCVADYGSARGIRSIFNYLYTRSSNNLFTDRVEKYKMKTPSKSDISIIFNRYTPYKQTPSLTFASMHKLINDTFAQTFKTSIEDAPKIPDYHKIALLSSYHGKPLHKFNEAFEEVYDPEEDKSVQIDKNQIIKYRESINQLCQHILSKI